MAFRKEDNLSKNEDDLKTEDYLKTEHDLKIVKDHTALPYTAIAILFLIC